MAEVQDDEQWLYGDDKENERREKAGEDKGKAGKDQADGANKVTEQEETTEKDKEQGDKEDKGDDTEKKDGDDSSSDDDEPTVTIGKLVKQPDIIRPPAPTHRAAPTAGLKEDDFNAIGKINGIPLTEFNLNELEETPWRKPGADLSDYFNYGFNEETWNLYCDRQRKMRVSESGVGMGVIGTLNMGKPMHVSTPSSGMNNQQKYGIIRGGGYNRRDEQSRHENGDDSNKGNTIQVMTADRRIYSAKTHPNAGMESYGESNAPYGEPYYHGMGPPPNNNMFSGPPPIHNYPPPPPPADSHPLNVPPPGWTPSDAPPGQIVSVPGFEDVRIKQEPDDRWSPESRARRDSRERKRRRRSRSGSHNRRSRRSRSRERRSKSRERRRSRSGSRPRRVEPAGRRSKSKSKSKSPSHRHRRKRSKRDREED